MLRLKAARLILDTSASSGGAIPGLHFRQQHSVNVFVRRSPDQTIPLQAFERLKGAFGAAYAVMAVSYGFSGQERALQEKRVEWHVKVPSGQGETVGQVKREKEFLLLPYRVVLQELRGGNSEKRGPCAEEHSEKTPAEVKLDLLRREHTPVRSEGYALEDEEGSVTLWLSGEILLPGKRLWPGSGFVGEFVGSDGGPCQVEHSMHELGLLYGRIGLLALPEAQQKPSEADSGVGLAAPAACLKSVDIQEGE